METRYMPKELGLFCVIFLTDPLYIQWIQIIIVLVTLPITCHWVPLNLMWVLKRLHMNLLKIVIFLTLKIVLGYNPTGLKKIQTISKSKVFKFKPQINRNIVVPNVFALSKKNLYQLTHQRFGNVSITRLRIMVSIGLVKGIPKISTTYNNHALFFYLLMQLRLPEFLTQMSQSLPLGSRFKWILQFSMLNNQWIYLQICGYMFCHFIPPWIYIYKQMTTS